MSQQSFLQTTATGSDINFSITTFSSDEILVYVDGQLKSAGVHYNINPYNANGQSTVDWIGTAPTSPSIVRVVRQTDVLNNGNTAVEGRATFQAGSSVKAADLNNNTKQVLRALQEHNDQLIQTYDIEDGAVTTAKIKDGTILGTDISDSAAIPFIKLATGLLPSTITVNTNNITNGSIKGEDIETGALDGRYFTETESDARYFRQDSTETIASGDTWSNTDGKIATTAAINARIIDLIEEVGGFVPVTNETSFPDFNPDINNGNGTIVSIQAVSTNLVPSSGTVTIANGRGTGKPVIITGVTETIPQNFGVLLETTSTTHTYAFHRLTAIATEVHTIASNITTIQAVNNNQTNINAAVNNASNINKVADNEANINLVSGEITSLTTDLGFITNPLTTGNPGNDINTVADNIDEIKDVASEIEAGTLFLVDSSNKTTGSVVYYDGTGFKADTTTTKNTLVTGGNF